MGKTKLRNTQYKWLDLDEKKTKQGISRHNNQGTTLNRWTQCARDQRGDRAKNQSNNTRQDINNSTWRTSSQDPQHEGKNPMTIIIQYNIPQCCWILDSDCVDWFSITAALNEQIWLQHMYRAYTVLILLFYYGSISTITAHTQGRFIMKATA